MTCVVTGNDGRGATVTATTAGVLVQADSDSDGVSDSADLCPGYDDKIDTDNDGIPNGCDDQTITGSYTANNNLVGGLGNDTLSISKNLYNSVGIAALHSNSFNGGKGNDKLMAIAAAILLVRHW